MTLIDDELARTLALTGTLEVFGDDCASQRVIPSRQYAVLMRDQGTGQYVVSEHFIQQMYRAGDDRYDDDRLESKIILATPDISAARKSLYDYQTGLIKTAQDALNRAAEQARLYEKRPKAAASATPDFIPSWFLKRAIVAEVEPQLDFYIADVANPPKDVNYTTRFHNDTLRARMIAQPPGLDLMALENKIRRDALLKLQAS